MIRALPCSTSGTGATTSGTFWWWMRDALSPTRKSRSRTPSWRSRIAPAIIWRKSFDWATCRDVPLERLSAGTSLGWNVSMVGDAAPDRQETPQRGVSTADHSRLKAGSVGAIIGQFKSACTKRIWSAGFSEFAWQSRFYDHIIRNQESLDKIRDYILHNPVMWETDKDEPENLYM